ncbi:hypothetical protein N0V93_008767 [Gnomoniopsis smithogilvyi]|uniref:Aminoglycoside phosphotransferase domain-containing protein n=1 Tax=Gnomoniopsis smithogilvyi TaxID=1191159 RepID=A0A9W8YMA5_9PEZI|nr:hypothetical protein N0V93_008767 [Gnomoniopsis smithogilvyi]
MSTSRPSNKRRGFGDEAPDSSEFFLQINHVLTTADFNHLVSVALEARRSSETLSDIVTCVIDPSLFSYGFHHLVVEVAFSDDVFWIARIQHKPLSAALNEAETETTDFLSEVATMDIVRTQTSIPVPGHQSHASREFVYPFVLMEYLEGHTLPSSIANSVPREKLPKVAEQIAKVLFDLENLTFDKLGKVWCGQDGQQRPEIIATAAREDETDALTSLDWFLNNRREINKQALEQHPNDPEWRAACIVLNTALQDAVIKNRLHGPFPLCHVDFHYGNLLLDDDYKLRGIIDWDGAQAVPLERLACSPEFMTYPGQSMEYNEPIIYFRNLVRDFLKKLESSAISGTGREAPKTMLSAVIGTPVAEIVHRATYITWRRTIFDAKYVSKFMWGESISWADIVEKYGRNELEKG